MNHEPLTEKASIRICNHMNNDHSESVTAYAKYYGRVENFKSAKMKNLSPESMNIEVDNKTLEIKFDHILKDCSDAHKTLVQMSKTIPVT